MFDDKDFDNHFKTTRRLAVAWAIVSAGVSITVLVFVGWVIVKVMSHFGVI